MTIIKAKVLKEQFDVWAHFYKDQVGGKEYFMRSEAKIIRKGKGLAQTDAIIVMANPGSCTAIDQNTKFDTFPKEGEEKHFVAARPDPTQYQLMNLMKRMNWDCIKIFNLSNICTGNFREFKQFLKEFNEADYQSHSLSHEKRMKELTSHLELSPTLIYAWGGDSAIKDLTKIVIENEIEHNGLLHPEKLYYRHPKPAKYEDRLIWLNDMELQLKGVLE
jgi:hypothetical protein